MIQSEQQQKTVYYLFSPFLRTFHWTMVGCVTLLFITGLYITKPVSGGVGMEPTFASTMLSLGWVRWIHFLAAYILSAVFIFRIYGFVINKGDRLFPRIGKKDFLKSTIDVSMHYLMLRWSHKAYLRNPVARMSYVGLYSLLLLEFFTGFAMYYMIHPNGVGAFLFGWVHVLVGGEFATHFIHHCGAWGILLFAIGHIYMAIRADFMEGEGESSSMFSGIKFLEHPPLDLDDIMEEEDVPKKY